MGGPTGGGVPTNNRFSPLRFFEQYPTSRAWQPRSTSHAKRQASMSSLHMAPISWSWGVEKLRRNECDGGRGPAGSSYASASASWLRLVLRPVAFGGEEVITILGTDVDVLLLMTKVVVVAVVVVPVVAAWVRA